MQQQQPGQSPLSSAQLPATQNSGPDRMRSMPRGPNIFSPDANSYEGSNVAMSTAGYPVNPSSLNNPSSGPGT